MQEQTLSFRLWNWEKTDENTPVVPTLIRGRLQEGSAYQQLHRSIWLGRSIWSMWRHWIGKPVELVKVWWISKIGKRAMKTHLPPQTCRGFKRSARNVNVNHGIPDCSVCGVENSGHKSPVIHAFVIYRSSGEMHKPMPERQPLQIAIRKRLVGKLCQKCKHGSHASEWQVWRFEDTVSKTYP